MKLKPFLIAVALTLLSATAIALFPADSPTSYPITNTGFLECSDKLLVTPQRYQAAQESGYYDFIDSSGYTVIHRSHIELWEEQQRKGSTMEDKPTQDQLDALEDGYEGAPASFEPSKAEIADADIETLIEGADTDA